MKIEQHSSECIVYISLFWWYENFVMIRTISVVVLQCFLPFNNYFVLYDFGWNELIVLLLKKKKEGVVVLNEIKQMSINNMNSITYGKNKCYKENVYNET
jgi:hypothetical protein